MTRPTLASPPGAETRPYAPLGRQQTVWGCRDREVVVVGPADTGKTRTIFEKLHYALEHYPARGCSTRGRSAPAAPTPGW